MGSVGTRIASESQNYPYHADASEPRALPIHLGPRVEARPKPGSERCRVRRVYPAAAAGAGIVNQIHGPMRKRDMKDADRLERFTTFYEATKAPVFRAVLLARGGDRHAAEDAVAEAYERAFLRWDKLAYHPNPTGWVIRTAINHRVSMWRHHRREESQVAVPVAPEPEPLDPSLMRLIRDLPKGQRKVLALRVLLDFSTEQTAEALGVKQGTVKTQLHRALRQLRAHLKNPSAEEAQG